MFLVYNNMMSSSHAAESKPYPLLDDSDRRFAVGTAIVARNFGDAEFTQKEAGDIVAAETDGEISGYRADDYRFIGLYVLGRAGRTRLNLPALLAPQNIAHSRVTSELITLALAHTSSSKADRVSSLLHSVGIQSANPIAEKDNYVFGFIRPPKSTSTGNDLGLCALRDTRLHARPESDAPDDSASAGLAYIRKSYGGLVLSHIRLSAVLQQILGDNITPSTVRNIITEGTKRYPYFVLRQSWHGGTNKRTGLILHDVATLGQVVPHTPLGDIQEQYSDLDRLKIARTPLIPPVRPNIGDIKPPTPAKAAPVATVSAQPSSASETTPNTQRADTQHDTPAKHVNNRAANIARAVVQIRETLRDNSAIPTDAAANYNAQALAALRSGNLDELRGIATELANKFGNRQRPKTR